MRQIIGHASQLRLVLGAEAPACSRLAESFFKVSLRCFFKVGALHAIGHSTEGAQVFHQLVACELRLLARR